jgi:hypothetical protein
MKILSIDVGIKNLAFCLFCNNEDYDNSYNIVCNNNNIPNDSYFIRKWNVIDLSTSEEVVKKCCAKDKKGPCSKPAKYTKNNECFCIKHAKKEKYVLPSSDLKSSYINKQKLQKLIDIVAKYKIPSNYEKPKKADLVSLITDFAKENCYEELVKTSASDVDLITIGKNIKLKFDALFLEEKNIDYVIIENQISPIANRMKTIQGQIVQYFIMSGINVTNIEFISASNKLKEFETGGKTEYKDRKKLGIIKTQEILQNNKNFSNIYMNYMNYFNTHKKKDDLADSFLQGLWFIKNRI